MNLFHKCIFEIVILNNDAITINLLLQIDVFLSPLDNA